MAVKKGYLAKVYGIDTSDHFSDDFTTEDTTEDSTTMIYQIDDDTMRLWDPNEPIVLGGTDEDFDTAWMDRGVDWFTGRVKLTATGQGELTVSGKCFDDPIEIGEAYNWTVNETADIQDISAFGDEWKKKKALQKTWTGSFEKFMIDEYWFDITALAKIFIVKFYYDAEHGYQGFAVIPSLDANTNITDVARETVNLEGHWKLVDFDES